MRGTNTHGNVGKWFSFGTLGKKFYWIGSSTSRVDNGYDVGMDFNVETGLLQAPIVGATTRIYTGYDSGETGSVSCSNWFRSSGDTGWYNASYGTYLRPQTGSYGSARLHGNSKGDYDGLVIGPANGFTMMSSLDTKHHGLYHQGATQWAFYYNSTNKQVSVLAAQTT
jgi:hypothetical protein